MKLKLKKISTKSFILTFSVINVIAGFILGIIMAILAVVAPSEQGTEFGPWAILFFPILNGLMALAAGAFLTGIYNFLAKYLGGVELEFDETAS
jgi:hypothetical protein